MQAKRLAILSLALLPATAAAAELSSRYALQPSGQGFVRLDAETGAVSHCDVVERVWRCTPVIEDSWALAARIEALAAENAALAAKVEALTRRLGAIEASAAPAADPGDGDGEDAAAGGPGDSAAAAEPAAAGFPEDVMRRFFAMVRDMKREAK